jgi:hypothetical protein
VTVAFSTNGFSPFPVAAIGPPDAVLSGLRSSVAVGEELALDATDSSTPQGEIVGYEWSVGEQRQRGETAAVTLDEPGENTVRLTVTNDAGRTSTVTESVTVEASRESTSTGGDRESDTASDSGRLGAAPVAAVAGVLLGTAFLAARRR